MSRVYTLTREVLEQHHDQAFKWAMSCCDYDKERAREVIQMVYVEILEGKAVFHGKSSLRTWLYSVVRQLAWQHTSNMVFISSGAMLGKLFPPDLIMRNQE